MARLVEIDKAAWGRYLPRVVHAPFVQSWPYGEAQTRARRCAAHRFLLLDNQEEPRGLLQVLSYTVPLLGGLARVNQGPIFFEDAWRATPSIEQVREVTTAILRTTRARRWWHLGIAPNFPARADVYATLEQLGLRKTTPFCRGSALIDLQGTAEAIRAGLHPRWRNRLQKAEAAGMELESPPAEEALPWFIENYEQMMREKGCQAIGRRLLQEMMKQDVETWAFRILCARSGDERIGAHIVVGYGDTCTHFIDWVSPKGRELLSIYYLFWHGILLGKQLGYRHFDVGGLDPATWSGVAQFKRNLRPEKYCLAGEHAYSCLPIPFRRCYRSFTPLCRLARAVCDIRNSGSALDAPLDETVVCNESARAAGIHGID